MDATGKSVLAVPSLREFFRECVHGTLVKQHVTVEEQTEQYVVNLLTLFARTESLYAATPCGPRLKPLVVMLGEALEAPSAPARHHALQRLGDVSLFVAGFFAQGFAAKLIDIDYHIAMGGRAYGTLAEATARGSQRVLAGVFAELAAKFQPLVDALNEISESAYRHTDRDVLRLYELWMKTGSKRCYALLKRLGIEPSAAGRTAFAH